MSAAKPGRADDGTWLSNDATGQQAIEAIIAAVECLGAAVWMHTEQRAEFDGHIETAKAAAGLVDAGERPATWPDGSPKEALHPDGYPAEEGGT